MDTNEKTLIEE
jgi:uncharacterized repeat protein (TIGR02543 family)